MASGTPGATLSMRHMRLLEGRQIIWDLSVVEFLVIIFLSVLGWQVAVSEQIAGLSAGIAQIKPVVVVALHLTVRKDHPVSAVLEPSSA